MASDGQYSTCLCPCRGSPNSFRARTVARGVHAGPRWSSRDIPWFPDSFQTWELGGCDKKPRIVNDHPDHTQDNRFSDVRAHRCYRRRSPYSFGGVGCAHRCLRRRSLYMCCFVLTNGTTRADFADTANSTVVTNGTTRTDFANTSLHEMLAHLTPPILYTGITPFVMFTESLPSALFTVVELAIVFAYL